MPTSAPHTESVARFGHALSNSTRASILMALRDAPTSSGDLAASLGISPQKMSNHLACLLGCGLVARARNGRRSIYRLAAPGVGEALDGLVHLTLEMDPGCCTGEGCSCQ